MSGIYYRTFFSMGRVKTLKPAIQDRPVKFSSITSTGNVTIQGTTILSGSINVSTGGDLNVGAITASAILMDPVNIRSADGLVIGGAGDTFTTSGPANKFTVGGEGALSMSGSLTVHGSQINFTNLPTSDPGVVGRLYRDGATVKISI
jgi:hypothetical protein